MSILGILFSIIALYALREVYIGYVAFRATRRIEYKNHLLHRQSAKHFQESYRALESVLQSLGKLKLEVYRCSLLPFLESYQMMSDASSSTQKTNIPKNRELEPLFRVRHQIQTLLFTKETQPSNAALMMLANKGGIESCEKENASTTENGFITWFHDENSSSMKLGILGGMGLLSGIGNVFLWGIAGRFLSAESKKRLESAHIKRYQKRLKQHEIKTLFIKSSGINKKVEELSNVIFNLNQRFIFVFQKIETVIVQGKRWDQYSLIERKRMVKCYTLSKSLLYLLELNIVTAEGLINKDTEHLIENAKRILEKEYV